MPVAIERRKKYMQEWYRQNKAQADKRSIQWRATKRLELICQLGGKCAHCGEIDPIVLDFDHINDDGAQHRKITKKKSIVHILHNREIPLETIQLLCKNCNWRKEYKRRTKCPVIPINNVA